MVSRTAEQIVMRMTIPQLKKAIQLQKMDMAYREMSDNFYYINGRRAMDEMVLHTYEKELRIKEAMEKGNEKKNTSV